MKKLLIILLLITLWLPVSSQDVTLIDTKVEVRNNSGTLVASNYFEGVTQATGGNNIVVLVYNNDRVEVRTIDLSLEASNYFKDILGVAVTGGTKDDPRITFYYRGTKIEVRNKELALISTRYRQ